MMSAAWAKSTAVKWFSDDRGQVVHGRLVVSHECALDAADFCVSEGIERRSTKEAASRKNRKCDVTLRA